ncbi:uncharacterized protein TEOVI_000496200 [Trypanosoma equiperdum]|uniref:Uncharacterized protein n=1 Tax=Trypanosoma equiperdum TaxID=5694 RepID=A0A1G4IKI1_TRYEQ|nr:hypothetical protein TEOVI_000496200 [Trypanosoma equiperdum]
MLSVVVLVQSDAGVPIAPVLPLPQIVSGCPTAEPGVVGFSVVIVIAILPAGSSCSFVLSSSRLSSVAKHAPCFACANSDFATSILLAQHVTAVSSNVLGKSAGFAVAISAMTSCAPAMRDAAAIPSVVSGPASVKDSRTARCVWANFAAISAAAAALLPRFPAAISVALAAARPVSSAFDVATLSILSAFVAKVLRYVHCVFGVRSYHRCQADTYQGPLSGTCHLLLLTAAFCEIHSLLIGACFVLMVSSCLYVIKLEGEEITFCVFPFC